jgi:hypothetical protein
MSIRGWTSKIAPDQLLDLGCVRVEYEDDDSFQDVDASESILDPYLQRNKPEIPIPGLKKSLLTEAHNIVLLIGAFLNWEDEGKGVTYLENC